MSLWLACLPAAPAACCPLVSGLTHVSFLISLFLLSSQVELGACTR